MFKSELFGEPMGFFKKSNWQPMAGFD